MSATRPARRGRSRPRPSAARWCSRRTRSRRTSGSRAARAAASSRPSASVSFGLYRSAVVALVGESGSGKSTVAKMLAGQERPTGGEILLDGAPCSPWKHGAFRAYKSDVQMVFQDPFASLNPVHTVRYPLTRPGAPPPAHARAARRSPPSSTRLLERVRLTPAEHFLARYPHELSGGQRQRVAIARALAARPRVLLADEPVSMLDVSIRLEVLDLIDELRSQFELAVLYVTHDIASARYFADDTLVMYAGEIVERGPSEDVTQRPAHPYTQLLLASAPDPEKLGAPARARAIAVRRGARGARSRATVGCRFAPRCPFADDRCRAESPPLLRINSQRAAACWRLDVAAPDLLHREHEEKERGHEDLITEVASRPTRLLASHRAGRSDHKARASHAPTESAHDLCQTKGTSAMKPTIEEADGLEPSPRRPRSPRSAAVGAVAFPSASQRQGSATAAAASTSLIDGVEPGDDAHRQLQPVRLDGRGDTLGATSLIYEPLLQFDIVQAADRRRTTSSRAPTSGAPAASRSPSRSAAA